MRTSFFIMIFTIKYNTHKTVIATPPEVLSGF